MRDAARLTGDTTFGGWVFPGRGAVYFKRAAMENLFKEDLEREGRAVSQTPTPLLHNVYSFNVKGQIRSDI